MEASVRATDGRFASDSDADSEAASADTMPSKPIGTTGARDGCSSPDPVASTALSPTPRTPAPKAQSRPTTHAHAANFATSKPRPTTHAHAASFTTSKPQSPRAWRPDWTPQLTYVGEVWWPERNAPCANALAQYFTSPSGLRLLFATYAGTAAA